MHWDYSKAACCILLVAKCRSQAENSDIRNNVALCFVDSPYFPSAVHVIQSGVRNLLNLTGDNHFAKECRKHFAQDLKFTAFGSSKPPRYGRAEESSTPNNSQTESISAHSAVGTK